MRNETAPLQVNVAGRLERLPMTNYQRWIFGIIATAWLFDSMDLAAMTFILGSIKADLGLSTAQTGALASASFVGMFLGAGLAGLLSDRYGRKPIFQISMIAWGIGSLLCGLARNFEELVACRVLLGLGMGMELPIALALVSEIVPSKVRGKYGAILEGFLPVGFVCAGLLIYFILPHVGWRGVFMWLALPAAFLLVIRRYVPESPRWLESRGRLDEAEKTVAMMERKVEASLGSRLPEPQPASAVDASAPQGMWATFKDLWSPAYKKRTTMLWVVWFFTLLGYYGLTSWLGALLQQSGYDVTKSIIYTVVMSAGGIPGFIFAAWLLETIGRKKSAVFMLLGSAIAAYVYGQCAALKLPIEQVVTAGLALQFFMFGMWCVIYAYTPELYPTRSRATGAGIASSVGRIGSIIGPVGLGIILPVTGQGGVFAIGAGCFVISALTIALMGTETKGKVLEEVSA